MSGDAPFTHVPYSSSDAAKIRRMVLMPGGAFSCPVCEEELMLGPAVPRGQGHIRQVLCNHCQRSLIVYDRE